MGRVSTVALAAAAATAALLVLLPMLLVLPPDAETYEQESRRMFVEWKAKYRKRSAFRYAGEEECRYAVFKESRRHVARSRAAGVTTSGLNGLSARAAEEIQRGYRVRPGEGLYEQETRRVFVGWKAKYGKTYRDVGEEECRYMLFKGNRCFIVGLNAAAGQNVYGLNQFGDLTKTPTRRSGNAATRRWRTETRAPGAKPSPTRALTMRG